MMSVLNCVHKIDDPNNIIMIGYSDFTGQFDETVYTQSVYVDSLEDVVVEKLPNIKNNLFNLYLSLNVDTRAVFYPLVTAMNHAITYGDLVAAARMLELAPIPSELIYIRNQALYFFNIVYIIKRDNELVFTDSVQDIVET